ncbi:hypothetical protein WN944_026281 [Citrus x changshan-huyou]|uniref:Fe2OG dioxygenase domain-containing protein n=1 Tax=Citrus x changshan-huyou TaxID=2935761 RepID=A0AAP0LSR3_9ROSI
MLPFSQLLKLQNRFITWVRYYVCFCKAAAFLSGLLISRKLVDLAIVGVLITYFSDSEYSKVFTLQKAAIFTSIQDVILATLTVVAAWISCYAIRPLRILIFSTVSYILALGLLFCTASREFSETNFELLNMIGIILLAVGEVGAAPLMGPFLADQLREHGKGGRTENSNEDQVMAQKRLWWRFAWCCGAAAAFYANNIKTWTKTFMFTLLFMGGSLILLLLGIPFYHSRQIPPIDRFAIIRVVKTSLKKKHLNYPRSPGLFFSNDEGNETSSSVENIHWNGDDYSLLCSGMAGLMEGLAWYGCDEYSSSHFPERMEYHVSAISSFFVGIGSIFNIFFILANKGDFAETLDDSRLDKYYKSLTVISAVNVCYNLLLSILYILKPKAAVTRKHCLYALDPIVSELKAFDDTKAGVKGLVDAGITTIPQIFIQDHHTKYKFDDKPICRDPKISIPIVDLQRIHKDSSLRSQVIDQIRSACEEWGFFQVINHGIPTAFWIKPLMGSVGFLNKMLSAPTLFWKDTLSCVMDRDFSNPEDLPEACREIMITYNNLMWKTGGTLFELLSEALGLDPNYLKDIGCVEEMTIGNSYYPECPQPELSIGIATHSDPGFVTVLIQDQIGGLQVFHEDQWFDIAPVPGALVVNLGYMMQASVC